MSLVTLRKRKDVKSISLDSNKIRVIEWPVNPVVDAPPKPPSVRIAPPANRTFNNIRRGSVKIFSLFRSAKCRSFNL
jgi:hypothetical protein